MDICVGIVDSAFNHSSVFKTEGRRMMGVMTENELVGWYHQFNGHEFEQTPGDGEGQRSLAYYSPWGHKELDTIEQMN